MLVIDKSQKDVLIAELKKDVVAIIPTDTVYGLVTNFLNEKGYKKIFKLKQRNIQKKIAILVDSIEMAKQYAIINNSVEKLWNEYKAGTLTIIVMKKKDNWKNNWNDDKTVAIRITNDKWLQEIIRSVGPLWATSANIHNKSVITNIFENELKVDIIVDGGVINGLPSSVFDSINNIFIRN